MGVKSRLIGLALAVALLGCSATAQRSDAFVAYEMGDYAGAFEKFLPLANQGDVDAQFGLGQMYFTGKGVQQD